MFYRVDYVLVVLLLGSLIGLLLSKPGYCGKSFGFDPLVARRMRSRRVVGAEYRGRDRWRRWDNSSSASTNCLQASHISR